VTENRERRMRPRRGQTVYESEKTNGQNIASKWLWESGNSNKADQKVKRAGESKSSKKFREDSAK